MSNDLNLCQFIGRLGKDPETKFLPGSGDAVVNFSLAVGKSWKEKSTGDKKEQTTWVPIVAFGKLAEIMGQYLTKGQLVYISGEMRVRSYEKDGSKRYVTEVIANQMQMLGGKREGGGEQREQEERSAQNGAAKAGPAAGGLDDDETIPF